MFAWKYLLTAWRTKLWAWTVTPLSHTMFISAGISSEFSLKVRIRLRKKFPWVLLNSFLKFENRFESLRSSDRRGFAEDIVMRKYSASLLNNKWLMIDMSRTRTRNKYNLQNYFSWPKIFWGTKPFSGSFLTGYYLKLFPK